ncbi:hypothetical protein KEM54_006767 [Ascosphaera aggregata]|nr:hypothetical protein KEM54_006767 [Ascosphaera aggregata]
MTILYATPAGASKDQMHNYLPSLIGARKLYWHNPERTPLRIPEDRQLKGRRFDHYRTGAYVKFQLLFLGDGLAIDDSEYGRDLNILVGATSLATELCFIKIVYHLILPSSLAMGIRKWASKARGVFKGSNQSQGLAAHDGPKRRHSFANILATAGEWCGKTTQKARPLSQYQAVSRLEEQEPSSLPELSRNEHTEHLPAREPPQRPERPPPELCPSPVLTPGPETALLPVVEPNYPYPIILLTPPVEPGSSCGREGYI